MTMTPDARFQGLWPYSIEQQTLPMLIARLKAWRAILDEVLVYVDEQRALSRRSALDFTKLERRLHALQIHPNSPLSTLMLANPANSLLDSVAPLQTALARFGATDTVVLDAAHSSLTEIRAEISRKVKAVRTAIDVGTATVNKERQNTVSSIQLHERVSARTVVSSHHRDGQGNPVDPWLSERVLYKQLRTMVDTENAYQAQMVELLNEAKQFDARVIAALNVVLSEFLTARSAQFRTMMDDLQRAEQSTRAIDAAKVFRPFEDTYGLCTSISAWSTHRELCDFPYQIVEIGIVKRAVLRRPAPKFLGMQIFRSWTPALYVITESGYLHCFKTIATSSGKNGTGRTGGGVGGSAVGWKPSSSTTLQHYGNDEKVNQDEEEMAYQNLKKPKTHFSVMLKGRVTVEVVAEKAHEHVFVVTSTIVSPKSKGLAGMGVGVSGAAAGTRTVSYEIKASSESEMIDWISCLRAKIESYIPDGPPVPLFSTEQTINERLNEATTLQRKATTSISSPSSPASPAFNATTMTSSRTTIGRPDAQNSEQTLAAADEVSPSTTGDVESPSWQTSKKPAGGAPPLPPLRSTLLRNKSLAANAAGSPSPQPETMSEL